MSPIPLSSRSRRPDRRGGLRAALIAGLSAAGCAPAGPPLFATADRAPSARRQPDGVAVDPMPASVQGADRGSTETLGLVALTPPLAEEQAVAAVEQFFDAAAREDAGALVKLLTPRAVWTNASAGSGPAPAAGFFIERFRRLDYHQLAGRPLIRQADAEVYTFDDLEAPPPGRPARLPEMTRGDAMVRVRVLTPRVGPDRFFGDEMVFLLHPATGRYLIHFIAEEFQLP